MRAIRNLKWIGVALGVLVLGGIIGFHFIEGWSWFDGLYMVVITLSTIGYAEVHPLTFAGRVFNMAFIASGLVLVALAIGTLTQALLEFELTKLLGRRRMDRDIEKLAGHYIICGAGRVGRRVANELASESAAFVIIESDAEKLRKADSGWLTMEGDATRETVLRQARIEHAQGLVAATTTDATNIYIVLTARSLNPKFKIIARASEEAAEKHLHTAGADVVISPYSFAGHRIAQRFLRPNVLDFLDVATTRSGTFGMVIEELQVANVSPLAGKTIGSSHIHHEFGAIVLAIKRPNGETMFNPRADAPIMAGDYLILMGEAASLEKLEGLNAASAMTP